MVDIQKLISLIRDSSAKIKIEGLKAVDTIDDWSQYSPQEVMQLFEVVKENLNYPRSDVRMHVEHAHKRLNLIITDVMKNNPAAFASLSSADLVEEEPEEAQARKARPAKASRPGTEDGEVPPPRAVPKSQLKDSAGGAADIAAAIGDEDSQQQAAGEGKEPQPADQQKAASPARPRAAVKKPQMIVVQASDEGRFAKFFLTLVSLVFFAAFLALAYPQIAQNTEAGKVAMGATAAYLVLLFFPVSLVASTTKIRLAVFSMIGFVLYMCFMSGLGVDFGVSEKVRQFLPVIPDALNVNEFIVKFSVLLVFVSLVTVFLLDDHIGRGYRILLFMFGVFSMASSVENIMLNVGARELFLENAGIGSKIPFIYLKPFYFGVNIFLPLCAVTFLFEFFSDLFELSFKKMLASLLALAFVAGSGAFFYYNLNDLSVTNVSNLIIPQNMNFEKINSAEFYDSVHRFVVQRNDIKEAVLDRIRVEKVDIHATDENARAITGPEKVLPGPLKNPTISPNGIYLAYVAYDGKKSDIMLYNLKTGGEIVPLVADGAFNDFPSFSPTSDRIAFVSNKSGADNVYVVKINKTDLRQLTSTTTQKSHVVWAPQRSSVTFLENGALIRQPIDIDGGKTDKVNPREKRKLLESIIERVVPGVKATADISTLSQNQVTMKFKTSRKNLAEIFQEIAAVMVVALKVFEDNETIEKFVVDVAYFNDRIEVTTITAIVKQNLEDVKFVDRARIQLWLKNSTVTVNGAPKTFE